MMQKLIFFSLAALSAAVASAQTGAAGEEISLWEDDTLAESSAADSWQTNGFIEAGAGTFTRKNPFDSTASLSEVRGQFGANRYFGEHFFNFKLEGIGDGRDDDQWQVQARELYTDIKLSDSLSLRAGQQILTWGTGDYVFLNDFFAKDWQAMFAGREDSYLKAPQVALKFNWYTPAATINAVWMPVFTGDDIISGERFVYYNPLIDRIVAEPRVNTRKPEKKFKNGQFALRLAKNIDSTEYALYSYHGFHPRPLGFDPAAGVNTYPRMSSFGASIRRPLLGGIANIESAYWHFPDSKNGLDPFNPNDQWNFLLGYEREIATNITLGGQWMIEKMQDYNNARRVAANPAQLVDEWHHTLTARLNWTAMQQKLNTSLFVFYSPDSKDTYLKPKVSYRQDDHWQYEIGANVFYGKHNHTQWGQFKDNSNLYARVRYNF